MVKVKCKCGLTINGKSKKHAESNLIIHQRGKLHQRLIKDKK